MKPLKEYFRAAAARTADTRLARIFTRHAGPIVGITGAAGDLSLVIKDYIQNGRVPSPAEQVSGGLFLLVDGLMLLSGRDPRFKTAAGAVLLAGAGVLGFSGVGQPGQNMELFSSGIIGLQALSLIFEKPFQDFSARMDTEGKGLLKKIFHPIASHPVVVTSGMDIVFSKVLLAATALLRRDWGLLASSLLWSTADLGFCAADPLVKAKVLKERPTSAPEMAASIR